MVQFRSASSLDGIHYRTQRQLQRAEIFLAHRSDRIHCQLAKSGQRLAWTGQFHRPRLADLGLHRRAKLDHSTVPKSLSDVLLLQFLGEQREQPMEAELPPARRQTALLDLLHPLLPPMGATTNQLLQIGRRPLELVVKKIASNLMVILGRWRGQLDASWNRFGIARKCVKLAISDGNCQRVATARTCPDTPKLVLESRWS